MTKIKGIEWTIYRDYIAKIYGKEVQEKIKAAISDADRQYLFNKTILAISFIDYKICFNYLITAAQILGKDTNQFLREIGIISMQKSMSGLYRIYLNLGSVKNTLNNMMRFWGRIYSPSKMTLEWLSDKQLYMKITDFPDIPAKHAALHLPGIEELAAMAGAKNIKSQELKCQADGSDYCLLNLNWE